jgi:hypothetical protein
MKDPPMIGLRCRRRRRLDGTLVFGERCERGLAPLQAGGRLRASHVQARLNLATDTLPQQGAQ